MKEYKKRISKKASLMVMGLAALGIIGAGGLGASAFAAKQSGQDGLAARLAAKFGLNQQDVSAEIKAYKNERHSDRDAEVKQKISEALQNKVDDNTITVEQKAKIEAKLEEDRKTRDAEREANENSATKPTRVEIKARMDAYRTEMDAWLKEQGINLNLDDLLPRSDKHGRGDREGRRGGREN